MINKKVVKSKSFYKYSILIIIPLIGLVTGIILLRKGVILKDRLLSYIGLAGILITVGFYIWAFYYGNYNQKAKEQEIMTARYQLNMAVQEIEVYKLGNGHYPDSLQELQFMDIHAPIVDPISLHFFSKKFAYFNYKKIGDSSYTLFSSGLDQIPNNTDDVYPALFYFNSKKLGLIKESK